MKGAAVPLPLKGGGGAASIEGAVAPYEDWLRQCFYPLSRSPQKNEPPMRGSLILPEFVPKTKGTRFGAMLLDEERGRHGPPAIEGARPLRPLLRNRAIPTNTHPKRERTLVRDQWRLSPKRSYSPKAFAKSRAKYVRIISAPALFMESTDSSRARSRSIQPFCAAA